MAVVASMAATAAGWIYYAVVNPTIGAAAIAAVASIVNTAILVRHERRVDRRLSERRLVITRADDAVIVTDEDRRQLAERRQLPKTRTLRERRYRKRRDGPL